jgi:phosphatidylglycerol:prolipoprotein diacylglycerol transferase
MIPTLFVGSAALPTYPLFVMIAFWAGAWVAAQRAKRLGVDGDHVYNASLYGLVAGIVAARLWFVLVNWEHYAPDVTQAFALSGSALSPGEGVLVAGLVVLIYLQRYRVPLGLFCDAAAPGLALAIIIGHVGAFLGGVEAGRPWAVEIAGQSTHPVGLYEATAGLLILVVLYLARDWRPWPGFHLWLLSGLYSATRFVVEPFRARPDLVGDGFLAGQIVALAGLLIALAVMAYHFSEENQ